jgi:hypothetical protein
VSHAELEESVVDELTAVVRVDADDGKWEAARMCCRAAKTCFCALFGMDRFTVHPVAISLTVRVKQYWPELLEPSWAT